MDLRKEVPKDECYAHLVLNSDGDYRPLVHINKPLFTIGRAEDADLYISHTSLHLFTLQQ
jgi:hypothetical protein